MVIVLGPSSPGSPTPMSTSGSGSLESDTGKSFEGGRQVQEPRVVTQIGGSFFVPASVTRDGIDIDAHREGLTGPAPPCKHSTPLCVRRSSSSSCFVLWAFWHSLV